MSNENNEEAMSSEEIEKLARERVRTVVENYERKKEMRKKGGFFEVTNGDVVFERGTEEYEDELDFSLMESDKWDGEPLSFASFETTGGDVVFERGTEEHIPFDEPISFLTTFDRSKKVSTRKAKWETYEEAIAELVKLKRDYLEKAKLCEEVAAEYKLYVEQLK